ncbi:MAG: RNA-directed polymerase [Methanolobus sp.]|nr:RNA-directed polymerase [Methanolobus sp.]MDK2830924.1 RNA-directed polymerase [Methanolobus sp.]
MIYVEDVIRHSKTKFDRFIGYGLIPSIPEDEYNEQLSSFSTLTSRNLPYIYDINHFCDLTSSSARQIRFFLANKEKGYSSFKLRKKNGKFRTINAPSKKLKHVQRWVLDNILYKLDTGAYAHGFVPNKTIVTNAKVHANHELVLGIDLKDFFPSVGFGPVYYVFKSAGYNKKISWALADLCTYHWKLPQGAPTSPMLANLASLKLDNRIARYCSRRSFSYSRYADDITISGSYKLPKHKEKITKIIEYSGFSVNEDKTRVFSQGSQQKVTGLIVNHKVSIGRTKKKNLRAIVHNISLNGPVAENRDNDPFFKERLFGHLGYANAVEPDFARPLIQTLKKVDWSLYYESIEQIKDTTLKLNSLKRLPKTFIVNFNDIECFSNIGAMPIEEFTAKFREQLDSLKEKCERHSVRECADCLYIQDEIYKKCMKHIFGHYTGTTTGHHHGHEIYDMRVQTTLCAQDIEAVFLFKSGRSTTAKEDSVFRQFYDCIEIDNINLVSIVTNCNINNELFERLKSLMRKHNRDKENVQFYCLIMRDEMKNILYDFNKK